MTFDGSRQRHGFKELISIETFRNPCNGYLVDDNCAFGAEFFIIQPPALTKKETLTLVKNPSADATRKDRTLTDSSGKFHTWIIKRFRDTPTDAIGFVSQGRVW